MLEEINNILKTIEQEPIFSNLINKENLKNSISKIEELKGVDSLYNIQVNIIPLHEHIIACTLLKSFQDISIKYKQDDLFLSSYEGDALSNSIKNIVYSIKTQNFYTEFPEYEQKFQEITKNTLIFDKLCTKYKIHNNSEVVLALELIDWIEEIIKDRFVIPCLFR